MRALVTLEANVGHSYGLGNGSLRNSHTIFYEKKIDTLRLIGGFCIRARASTFFFLHPSNSDF